MKSLPKEAQEFEKKTNGRYKFQRILGQGSYGVVYSAIDTKTKKYVAIKQVLDIFDCISDAKRTLREIKILASLKHENITKLIDVKSISSIDKFDSLFIIIDLMDTDLGAILETKQKLTEDHRRFFMYQILRGLKYIHSANILHRDLKPSNLLVNSNCDLEICDFGLARIQEDNNLLSEYVETRWYRAPEVLLQENNYGPAIDIWSTGCVFYELIMRRPMFPGKSSLDQIVQIVTRIGSPKLDDIAYVTNAKARKLVLSIEKRTNVDWNKLIPRGTKDEIDLIQKMLTWDPAKRISADEALEHPYFKDLHDPFDEPITYPMDKFEFDRENVKMNEMRKYIWDEVENFQNKQI